MTAQSSKTMTTSTCLQHLTNSGFRVTKTRELLLNQLQTFHDLFTVQDLLNAPNIKESNLHTATIYRDLALFRSLGWIQEISFATHSEHYYEWNPRHEVALYANCERCGKVSHVELTEAQISSLEKYLKNKVLTNTKTFLKKQSAITIKLYGECNSCEHSPQEQK